MKIWNVKITWNDNTYECFDVIAADTFAALSFTITHLPEKFRDKPDIWKTEIWGQQAIFCPRETCVILQRS